MSMRYSTYPEYKYVGCSWLDRVPSHWGVMQLKRTVDGCVNGIWGAEPKNDGTDMVVIRVADFDRPILGIKDDDLTHRSINEGEMKTRSLKPGDLLLEKSGGGEKTLVGQVVLFEKNFPAVTSNFVAKMTPVEGFDSRFLNYVFCRFYSENINYCSIKQSTGIQNLDSSAYLSEKFGFPPECEQQKIADFLDHETTKIDTLIEKQQQLIKLLKEKRQAVISHAVTKGLNPNATMRDSGVEWLGEVPEHWRVVSLKHMVVAPIIDGPHVSPTRQDRGVPFISAESISNGKINFDKKWGYISEQDNAEYSKRYSPKVGDILMVKLGATTGRVAMVETEGFNVWVPLATIRITEKYPSKFFFYLFQSSQVIDAINLSWTYGTQQTLGLGTLANMSLPVPSAQECEEIVEHIEMMVPNLDALVAKADEFMGLLQERRTALISAAVTGKIDIRDWQPPAGQSEEHPVESLQDVSS